MARTRASDQPRISASTSAPEKRSAAGPQASDDGAAHELVRELKAVGGDLRALLLALTGATRGPELWAVLVALPRDEARARTAASTIAR